MEKKPICRFIFISGGVVSSLGKGIAAASIGKLLKENGLAVGILKLDPYLNVDPGTMSPNEHGEVFVTEDGGETDLDLGHYERFLGEPLRACHNVTAGKIYKTLIDRERAGEFQGKTVQVIPHLTEEIKHRIRIAAEDKEVLVVEIGGTVGDIEALPFLTAVQQFASDLPPAAHLHVHLTWLPEVAPSTLLKTKPTQHSLKALQSSGIMPDMLICRANRVLDEAVIKKLHVSCGIPSAQIFSMPTTDWVYRIPYLFHQMGLLSAICKKFRLSEKSEILGQWSHWLKQHDALPMSPLTIVIVAKYSSNTDAYKSCHEALQNSGIAIGRRLEIQYLDAQLLEETASPDRLLAHADGILVPGGFGHRGIEGKMAAIRFARENKRPFFGICLGMQLALIEACRHILGILEANSTEFDAHTAFPIISLVTEWQDRTGLREVRKEGENIGGTLRLGAQKCVLKRDSAIARAYGTTSISERHRHRYEVNLALFKELEEIGFSITGRSEDERLVEAVEIPAHPWFVACQYHPEFQAKAPEGHPLFTAFLKAALEHHCAKIGGYPL